MLNQDRGHFLHRKVPDCFPPPKLNVKDGIQFDLNNVTWMVKALFDMFWYIGLFIQINVMGTTQFVRNKKSVKQIAMWMQNSISTQTCQGLVDYVSSLNLALCILFILTLWWMLFPMSLWSTLRKLNINLYISAGLVQHVWTMAACTKPTMPIWVAKSLYLTGS